MAKTILVTGGAGFVGSHLCERLQQDGHRVISLDNYFTGTPENHIEGVEYREGHTKDIAALVPETPDLVFHLGEYSRTAIAMEEPDVVFDMNIIGTLAVVEYWRTHGCKLIYAGSSTKDAPTRADGITGRNLSPYTWSKATNTDLINNYGVWYNLPYAIAYFYNVYGPRELTGRYGTVVEIFAECLRTGQPAPVNGPGTQTRAYTHVLDTVDALVMIGEQGQGDEYGIAADDVYSPLELAAFYGLEVDLRPARKTSRPASHINTEKTQTLGWRPQHKLTEYIEARKAEFQ